MRRRRARSALCAVAVLVLPCSVAWANGGTLLLYTEAMHLVFGNFVLGLIEAGIVCSAWGLAYNRTAAILILGNFASLGAGVLAAVPLRALIAWAIDPNPLGLVRWTVAPAVLFLIALSIVVEWPFVHAAVRVDWPRLTRDVSLKTSALATGITSLLIVLVYIPGTETDVFRETKPSQRFVAGTANDAWVWYVAPGGRLSRIRLNGTGREPSVERVRLSNPPYAPRQRLALCEGEDERADLVRVTFVPGTPAVEDVLVPAIAREMPYRGAGERPASVTLGPDWGKPPLAWHREAEDHWRVRSTALDESLLVRDQALPDGARTRVRLQLPPLAVYPASQPWILPDDRVVFQFGPWIMLLDPETRQIGKIARGRCPIVVPDPLAGKGELP